MIITSSKLTKRIILSMFLIVFTLGTLCGCGSKKNISLKDMNEKITENINMTDMKSSDKERFEKLYKVNDDDIEDFSFYAPVSNLKASQIVVVKIKDSNKVDEIKETMKKYVDLQGTSFKDYLPKEYYLIEKHVLKSNGNYILLAISKDADKIEKIFDESFK